MQDIIQPVINGNAEKAARCGEPSYVWRAGQQRRLGLIVRAAGRRLEGRVLENGCGMGMYMEHLQASRGEVTGLEYDLPRAQAAHLHSKHIVNGAGEALPFTEATFDLILSNEVLEHVQDDHAAVREMVRALKSGGRVVIFCPNRGYPFETHGIYWRGKYRFGNKLFVNYLPRAWRDHLAPHVRVYSCRDMEKLLTMAQVKVVEHRIIFGGYDNIVARFGRLGRILRDMLQSLEKTPLQILGLSHFWVIEKV